MFILFLVLQFSSVNSATVHAEDFQSEEHLSLAKVDPFPSEVAAVDPLSKAKVDRVLTGPAYKSRHGADFDYYRYVTFYNVDVRKERIYSLPIQHEECHDKSDFFGSYSFAYTFTASVQASLSIEGLGLNSTITQSKTLTAGRNIRATGKIVADHTPYMLKEDWEGRTFIQVYHSKTKKTEYLLSESKGTPWWLQVFFPAMAREPYPFSFKVKDAEWSFQVERTILSHCSTDD